MQNGKLPAILPAVTAFDLFEVLRKEWSTERKTIPWNGAWKDWTSWVKSYFYDKGEDLGFKSETKLSDRGEGEYIVDLCWWSKNYKQYWLELILESEWGEDWKSEVNQDFYKLIDLKAHFKVWVCSWTEKQMDKRREKLCEYIAKAKFKLPEEEYLIINVPYSEEAGHEKCMEVHGIVINNLGISHTLPPFEVHAHL